MKNFLCASILILYTTFAAFAQSPNWSVDENNFQYTMTFVSFLTLDGTRLANTNDKVAAFVNGECRGVTNLMHVESEDRYFAYLNVFSNENGETIAFQIYDSANNDIRDVGNTQAFEINEHYGNLFQTYSVAEPELSNAAELITFGFKDVAPKDIIFEGNQVRLQLDSSIDVTKLTPEFATSPGAGLYRETIAQISGENEIDFTKPVTFQVLSQNKSVLKEWTVSIQVGSGDVTYYKKDAVCYEGGAIKVVSTFNGEEVQLVKDGNTFSSQTIDNGETIFNNLEPAAYLVKIGTNMKNISIYLSN